MILGQWCQVPQARPSLRSPLRAFVGSSDKLVRGAGKRPPPNRLSQKGEENERLRGGGGFQPQAALWERGGKGGPSSEGVLRNQTPALKDHWGQSLRTGGFREKLQGAFLISPTMGHLSTYHMPGTQPLSPSAATRPFSSLSHMNLPESRLHIMIPIQRRRKLRT